MIILKIYYLIEITKGWNHTNHLWEVIEDGEYTTQELHDAIEKTIEDYPDSEKVKGKRTARYNHLVNKTLPRLKELLLDEETREIVAE